MRMLLVSSSGGHLVQLFRLSASWEKHERLSADVASSADIPVADQILSVVLPQ